MADEAEMEQAHPAGTGVLKRLLQARVRAAEGAGKAPQLPQTAPVTPARATATAIGRAADRLYGLGVRPVEVRPGALTLAELPELLPDPALLAVLQGPGDAVGVMALCPQTVTALIEIQTLGRVTGRPLARRRLTRSDAALCADFIDTFLSELAQEGRGVEGLEEFRGFRYATHIDDARPLALMMEDRAYRSLGLKLLLGGSEAGEGRLFLALPQPRPDAERPQPALAQPAVATAPSKRPAVPPLVSLRSATQQAPVEVVGILCRRRMSLRELRGLTPGKILALPRVSLSDTRIETADGQVLAIGKFGEADGCHAIRLRDPVAPAESAPAAVHAPEAPMMAPITGPELPIVDLHRPDAFRPDPTTAATVSPPERARGSKAG